MKEHLKNKWKQVHATYKSKQKEGKVNSEERGEARRAEVKGAATASEMPMNVQLPYYPGSKSAHTTADEKRDIMLDKLLIKL